MNRHDELDRVCGVEHTPITDAELIESCKASSESFGLQVVVMLREPLNLCCDSVGYSTVELSKIFERVWSELNMNDQRRLYLLFTSSKGTRSVDCREDARRDSISWVNSRPASGSVNNSCSSSWIVFLIRAWSSSTVKSATFIRPTFDFENSDFLVGKSTKGRKVWNHREESRERMGDARGLMLASFIRRLASSTTTSSMHVVAHEGTPTGLPSGAPRWRSPQRQEPESGLLEDEHNYGQ